MYMAFVFQEDNEDLVSFYVRENNGNYKIYHEYIIRGDTYALKHYINCYMFEKKENQDIKVPVEGT